MDVVLCRPLATRGGHATSRGIGAQGRRELTEAVWGFSCDCPSCEGDVAAGRSSGDWRVTAVLRDMEALLETAEHRRCVPSVRDRELPGGGSGR